MPVFDKFGIIYFDGIYLELLAHLETISWHFEIQIIYPPKVLFSY